MFLQVKLIWCLRISVASWAGGIQPSLHATGWIFPDFEYFRYLEWWIVLFHLGNFPKVDSLFSLLLF
jgi:hypothetical protein